MPAVTLELAVIVKGRLENLCKTICSIESQGLRTPELSVLVVNGEPSDYKKIAAIIASYRKSLNIRIVNQSSRGIFPAMNEAVLFSSSRWIQFVNSGDQSLGLEPLLALLRTLNECQVDGIIGSSIVKSSDESFVSINPLFFPLSQSRFLLMRKILPSIFSVCHQSVVFSRPFHLAHLYQDLCIASDAAVINNLLESRWVSFPFPLSCFYTDGVSSVAPRSFDAFKKLAISCMRIGEYRRLVRLVLKYILFGRLPPQSLDAVRRLRFLLFSLLFGRITVLRNVFRNSVR